VIDFEKLLHIESAASYIQNMQVNLGYYYIVVPKVFAENGCRNARVVALHIEN
jgi:hypothetical protein